MPIIFPYYLLNICNICSNTASLIPEIGNCASSLCVFIYLFIYLFIYWSRIYQFCLRFLFICLLLLFMLLQVTYFSPSLPSTQSTPHFHSLTTYFCFYWCHLFSVLGLFISALIFINYFLLLIWGLICFYLFAFLRWKFKIIDWSVLFFLIYIFNVINFNVNQLVLFHKFLFCLYSVHIF